MKKIRMMLICLLFLFVLIVSLPLLIPLNSYKPQLEKRLSALLQAQVQLENIEFAYQPLPFFSLKGIKMDGGAGSIEQIRVPLSVFNLFHYGKSLKNVEVDGVRLSPSFAFSLPKRFATLEQGRITLGDVLLTKSSVVWDQNELGPIDGLMKFADNGAFADLRLADKQGHLEMHIKPSGENIRLTVQASGWEIPLGYPVVFEKLYMSGEGSSAGLLIDDIRGESYGGVLSGKAMLTWADDWVLAGQVSVKGVHTEPFSKVFSTTTFVSGRMDGEGLFNYRAKDYLKLFAHPMVDFDFLLRDGALHNLDLITQLRSGSPASGRGGQTRFDTLKGKIIFKDSALQIKNLALDAGKFSAQGAVSIAKAGRLEGGVSARLQSGVLAISNHIRIGGDLSRPALSSGDAARPTTE
ncbi:AsmA family protein [Iodobacter sp.]|uniref:AsmA family protein n=1 Tax=Iodobacter sp. TaxID=1915058 RepID=UPI0025EBB09B|nr:AsmA family protein [Iodobacter sp.]